MFVYFPAVRGTQGGFEYYSVQVKFGELANSFVFDDTTLPLEMRCQRELNIGRARKFAEYINTNPDTFITGAVLGTVDDEVKFIPFEGPFANGDIGMLQLPANKRIVLCDGQHRQAGIGFAMENDKTNANNTLPIILYSASTKERQQQIFTDVNSNQVKPASSLSMSFDHRSSFVSFVKDVGKRAPRIRNAIEYEKNSVGAKSLRLWPLVSFKSFIVNLTHLTDKTFDERIQDAQTREKLLDVVVAFIQGLDNLPLWKDTLDRKIQATELRQDYVVCHAVFLEALGHYGAHLMQQMESIGKADWSLMEKLANVPVDKASYIGRCVSHQGTIEKNSFGIKSTAALICKLTDTPLSDDLRDADGKVAAKA